MSMLLKTLSSPVSQPGKPGALFCDGISMPLRCGCNFGRFAAQLMPSPKYVVRNTGPDASQRKWFCWTWLNSLRGLADESQRAGLSRSLLNSILCTSLDSIPNIAPLLKIGTSSSSLAFWNQQMPQPRILQSPKPADVRMLRNLKHGANLFGSCSCTIAQISAAPTSACSSSQRGPSPTMPSTSRIHVLLTAFIGLLPHAVMRTSWPETYLLSSSRAFPRRRTIRC